MNQSIERFMKGRVLVLSEAASAQEAARAMYERRGVRRGLQQRRRMAGLVTDRDIATQLVAFAEPLSTPLREIMGEPMYSSRIGNTPMMLCSGGHGLRHVPIIRRSESGQENAASSLSMI